MAKQPETLSSSMSSVSIASLWFWVIMLSLQFAFLFGSQAAPVCFGGHAYDIMADSNHSNVFNWTTAYAIASSTSFGGCTGYLATVTSSGETNFLKLLATAVSANGAWIGGLLTNATANEFRWVTGPENGQIISFGRYPLISCAGYCNWMSLEPDGDVNGALEFYAASGVWNDYSGYMFLDAFLIEYGDGSCQPCSSPSVLAFPSASSLPLSLNPRVLSPGVSLSPRVLQTPSRSSVTPSSGVATSATLTMNNVTSRSPTPTHRTTSSVVYYSAPCEKTNRVDCPNGKCADSLKDCEVDKNEFEAGVDDKLKEQKIFVTSNTKDKEIVVGLNSESGDRSFGRVVFPKGALKTGWVIFIKNSKKKVDNYNNDDNNDECGKKKNENKKQKAGSVVFDVTVEDSHGKRVKIQNLDPPIQLFAYASISHKVLFS
eukprot:TRINITY_DN5784_c0_g1_i1.p1 TRINITY_DN5784_c0_g1~~TRINITY_DN5784_c0_g1_i1.p1  ORF type:complete len:430 (-),score=67.20 TRINITY_DN5784_c0_g1_i1:561-1850(-)